MNKTLNDQDLLLNAEMAICSTLRLSGPGVNPGTRLIGDLGAGPSDFSELGRGLKQMVGAEVDFHKLFRQKYARSDESPADVTLQEVVDYLKAQLQPERCPEETEAKKRSGMHEVVITGIGIVSSLGTGVVEFGRRMFAGDSGVQAIREEHVASNFPVPVGGPVRRGPLPQPKILRDRAVEDTPHFLRLAGVATEEAVHYLPPGLPVDAIVYGGHGSIAFSITRGSFRSFSPETFDWDAFQPESPLELMRQIAEARGHGPIDTRNIVSLNNACVTSNQAIGVAFQRVRSGQWSRVITGAVYGRWADSELMNFHMLGTLTTAPGPAAEASRPFSKDRSGFVLGEGAATLVLETRESAEMRGADILGVISGYSSTSDAYRVTDGRPDGKAAAQAIRNALADADLPAEQISAVSAHGTSTPMNDRVETMAIKEALGNIAYKVPVISLKSQVGHSVIAAGALEAVACVLMLSEQKLAPTINYREFDPDCDLDYVPNHARPARVQTILSNNFGFGGQNASVIFEGIPRRREPLPAISLGDGTKQ